MVAKIDMTGEKHGRWTIIKDIGGGRLIGLCDCGAEKNISKYNVRSGSSKGCGCVKSKPGRVGLYLCWQSYKIRSKKKGINFELSKDEFEVITKKDCLYCGSPPFQVHKNGYKSTVPGRGSVASENTKYTHNGIDRMNPKLGYTLKNSAPCCKNCNFAKLTLGKEEFRKMIIRIYNHWAKNEG